MGSCALDGHAAVRARDLDLGQHLGHERRERRLLAQQRQLTRLQTRELQQLLDQPSQAFGLRQHHLQRRGIGLLHAVQQVLQVRADRGDRRLELVGHVREQVATGLLEVLQLGAHPVERRRELSDLVARSRVHPLRVVAGLHLMRRGRHVPQWLRHAAREPARHDERDAGGQRPRHEELPPEVGEEPERLGDPCEQPLPRCRVDRVHQLDDLARIARAERPRTPAPPCCPHGPCRR